MNVGPVIEDATYRRWRWRWCRISRCNRSSSSL